MGGSAGDCSAPDGEFDNGGIESTMVGEANIPKSLFSAERSGIGDTIIPQGDLSTVP